MAQTESRKLAIDIHSILQFFDSPKEIDELSPDEPELNSMPINDILIRIHAYASNASNTDKASQAEIDRLRKAHAGLVTTCANATGELKATDNRYSDLCNQSHRTKVELENTIRRLERQVDKLIDCLPMPPNH